MRATFSWLSAPRAGPRPGTAPVSRHLAPTWTAATNSGEEGSLTVKLQNRWDGADSQADRTAHVITLLRCCLCLSSLGSSACLVPRRVAPDARHARHPARGRQP